MYSTEARVLTLAIFLTCVSLAFSGQKWQSPDDFYSIVSPSSWTQSEAKSEGHSSYAFRSPDGKAEVRISAGYNLKLPNPLPDILEPGFRNEQGLAPIKKVRGRGWDGLRREYTNANKSMRWIGIAAHRHSTIVFLTMNAPSADFEQFRPTFDSVENSLQLGQQMFSYLEVYSIAQMTLQNFWGKVKLANEKFVRPKNETDRKTIPISDDDVQRIVDAAVPAGAAFWARVEWESYYDEFMKGERRSGRWSDKQIAFVGVLFGTVQVWTKESLGKVGCDLDCRNRTSRVLAAARSHL